MQKPELLISVEAIMDYLRFCQLRDAEARILPTECAILVAYLEQLHACNITLVQALSEVED